MRLRLAILALALLPVAAGCVTTDEKGRPIAREVRAKPAPVDVAIAEATLDGSRVVASGRAGAVSFLYPGTGRLAVRDVTANSMPFSIELTERDGPAVRTLIAIAADGKLTGTTSNGTPVVTELGQLDRTHQFVITFQAAAPLATPRGGEAR